MSGAHRRRRGCPSSLQKSMPATRSIHPSLAHTWSTASAASHTLECGAAFTAAHATEPTLPPQHSPSCASHNNHIYTHMHIASFLLDLSFSPFDGTHPPMIATLPPISQDTVKDAPSAPARSPLLTPSPAQSTARVSLLRSGLSLGCNSFFYLLRRRSRGPGPSRPAPAHQRASCQHPCRSALRGRTQPQCGRGHTPAHREKRGDLSGRGQPQVECMRAWENGAPQGPRCDPYPKP